MNFQPWVGNVVFVHCFVAADDDDDAVNWITNSVASLQSTMVETSDDFVSEAIVYKMSHVTFSNVLQIHHEC